MPTPSESLDAIEAELATVEANSKAALEARDQQIAALQSQVAEGRQQLDSFEPRLSAAVDRLRAVSASLSSSVPPSPPA